MKILLIILGVIVISVNSHAQIGNIETATATVQSLVNLYGSECDESIITAVADEFRKKIDFGNMTNAAFGKKYGCNLEQTESQSKRCLSYLDSEFGSWAQKELKTKGCQIKPIWLTRLAANNCRIERDLDQMKSDLKNGQEQMARGYCTYKATKCENSSFNKPKLEEMSYNCALVPNQVNSSFQCLAITDFSSCSIQPIKGHPKFSPQIKPGGWLSKDSNVNSGADGN